MTTTPNDAEALELAFQVIINGVSPIKLKTRVLSRWQWHTKIARGKEAQPRTVRTLGTIIFEQAHQLQQEEQKREEEINKRANAKMADWRERMHQRSA